MVQAGKLAELQTVPQNGRVDLHIIEFEVGEGREL